eukprot:gene6057-4357_t
MHFFNFISVVKHFYPFRQFQNSRHLPHLPRAVLCASIHGDGVDLPSPESVFERDPAAAAGVSLFTTTFAEVFGAGAIFFPRYSLRSASEDFFFRVGDGLRGAARKALPCVSDGELRLLATGVTQSSTLFLSLLPFACHTTPPFFALWRAVSPRSLLPVPPSEHWGSDNPEWEAHLLYFYMYFFISFPFGHGPTTRHQLNSAGVQAGEQAGRAAASPTAFRSSHTGGILFFKGGGFGHPGCPGSATAHHLQNTHLDGLDNVARKQLEGSTGGYLGSGMHWGE